MVPPLSMQLDFLAILSLFRVGSLILWLGYPEKSNDPHFSVGGRSYNPSFHIYEKVWIFIIIFVQF